MKRNRFEARGEFNRIAGQTEDSLANCKFDNSTIEEIDKIYDDMYQKAIDSYREYKVCQEEYKVLKAKKEDSKIDKIKRAFRLKELKAKMKALKKISDLHTEALVQLDDVKEYTSKFNKIKNYDYDPKIYSSLNGICNKSITKTEIFFMFFIIGLMALVFFMFVRL
jgi:hypothetical protein